jgi:hypothetical protein
MKKFVVFVVVGLTLIFISGCNLFGPDIPPEEPQYENFDSPEDMLDNPVVIEAIDESGFDYTLEFVPAGSPQALDSIEGVYSATGQVNDSDVSQIIGERLSSEILLFRQTPEGEIDYVEKIGSSISVSAWGSFIRGSGTEFTLYLEGENTVQGITLYNVTMISGDIYPNGNIIAEGLTTNIRKENAEGYLVPEWYIFNIAMSLQPVPTPQNFSGQMLSVEGSNMITRFSWEQVDSDDITGYRIYRDGVLRANIVDAYSDYYLLEPRSETHSYYIVAVGLNGETESTKSNTVTLVIP